jgi:membrane-bound lytic murein transglycosylase D
MTLAPEIVTRRSTVKARKGETVASIARRYGLSADAVAEWNKVGTSAAFKLGHQVVLFLPVKAVSAARPRAGKAGVQAVSRAPGKAGVQAVKRTPGKTVIKTKKR